MGEKTDYNARSMESMDPPICSPAKEPLAGGVSRLTQQIGGLFQHCLDGGAAIIHLLGQLLRAHKLADLCHFRHRLNKLGIQGDLLQRGLQGRHHFIRRTGRRADQARGGAGEPKEACTVMSCPSDILLMIKASTCPPRQTLKLSPAYLF